jgi:SAM-dependent methyltransferase
MSEGFGSWVSRFDVRSAARRAGRREHLHQTAGWYDIDDAGVWRDYVHDVVGESLRPGSRVFEAGCGVLAFLEVLWARDQTLSLSGIDGSAESIAVVRDEIAPGLGIPADRFRVGQLPEALECEATEGYELTLCNSVLQYLGHNEAWRVIEELYRMTAPGGALILSDLCDAAHRERENAALAAFWDGYASAVPEYTFFETTEFGGRAPRGATVEVRRSTVAGYLRRESRFIIAIHKPGAGSEC